MIIKLISYTRTYCIKLKSLIIANVRNYSSDLIIILLLDSPFIEESYTLYNTTMEPSRTEETLWKKLVKNIKGNTVLVLTDFL